MNDLILPGEKPKHYMGKFKAVIVSVSDPEHWMRAQVRVLGRDDQVPDSELPWAEYLLPVGAGANRGGFLPASVGDYVWVEYPYNGDTRRPLIVGAAHYCPDGDPNMPHEAWSGTDSLSHKRTGEEPAPGGTGYHRDVVFTRHGVTLEIAEDGSVRVTQRGSGSAIEIAENGDITVHGEKNVHVSAGDDCNVIVEGDANIEVTGDVNEQVMGNVTSQVMGAVTLTAMGAINCQTSVAASVKCVTGTIIAGGPLIIQGKPIMVN